MAYIILNNNKAITVDADKATRMWLVLNGYEEGDEAQQEFCSKVKSIHLNWRNAPDEWIKDNFDRYKQCCKDYWYVDNQGKPTRPQYNADWEIKRRWNI